jgi:zinc protease
VSQLSGAATQILQDSLPLDYYANLTRNYEAASVAAVNEAAKKYVDPSKLVIVVVGDRKQIEDRLRALNLAPVVVVDEQAKPVAAAAPSSGGAGR